MVTIDASQLELFSGYQAQPLAKQLRDDLEERDADFNQVFVDFLNDREADPSVKKTDSYAVLEVVGLGHLTEAFVWWMEDDSVLMLGWVGADKCMIGVLPPEATFTPMPYTPEPKFTHDVPHSLN